MAGNEDNTTVQATLTGLGVWTRVTVEAYSVVDKTCVNGD